jgi:hypothetical protein
MTIQNVNDAITKLENLDPNDSSAYEKAIIAYLAIKQIPYLIYEFTEELIFFRTRTHETDNFFQSFSDIEAAPPTFVKSFGRCNRPFQSVFYCSENRPTSYMELVEYWAKDKIKDQHIFVTLSQWTLKKPLQTLIVSSPLPKDRLSNYDKSHGDRLDHFINQYHDEFKEAMILFYKFLFDKFRKAAKNDLKTYIITSAYCNLAFAKASGQIDAIFYPSVPFQGQGVNFAIAPHFNIEKSLDLNLVIRNKFTIEDIKPSPIFTETELIHSKSLDKVKRQIIW